MKKNILAIILILILKTGFSQTYFSNYLDMTSEWKTFQNGFDGFHGYSIYMTSYFDGYEIFNDFVYYKYYTKREGLSFDYFGNAINESTLTGPSYIREDPNGKFYSYSTSNSNESVWFDSQIVLNAQVGDAFPNSDSSCTVYSTEIINLGTIPLKKLNGSITSPGKGSIEGIGVIGIPCSYTHHSNLSLNCYTKQGITIQFGSENCDLFPTVNRVNLSLNSNLLLCNNVKMYPNPFTDILNIEPKNNIEIETIKIFNFLGQLVHMATNVNNTKTVSVSDLKRGTYIVEVKTINEISHHKIIKQ